MLRLHRFAIVLGVVVGFAVGAGAALGAEPDREHGSGTIRVHGHGAEYWHWEYVKAARRVAALERRLAGHSGSATVGYATRIAAAAYGVPLRELRAVARCETGGTMSAQAFNSSSGAAGLMQFLASTWRDTPFAPFSRFDPVANVLAAAQIVEREGWAQWSCGWAAAGGG